MSVTLLDIYNKVTGQSWSIYNTGIETADEVDSSVLNAIQKALKVIWLGHSYCFRLKNKEIKLISGEYKYNRPSGNIVNSGVRLLEKNTILKPTIYTKIKDNSYGEPKYFYIKYNKLCVSPIPEKDYTISVDYNTFYLGKTATGSSIYNLKELTDELDIPEMFEDLFINTLINKSMLNALASGKSELYEPYLQQFIETYKSLVLNTSGLDINMEINW